jgi:cysteine synthase A
VSILCDDGARYADTIFDADWLAARDLDVAAPRQAISDFFETGRFAG